MTAEEITLESHPRGGEEAPAYAYSRTSEAPAGPAARRTEHRDRGPAMGGQTGGAWRCLRRSRRRAVARIAGPRHPASSRTTHTAGALLAGLFRPGHDCPWTRGPRRRQSDPAVLRQPRPRTTTGSRPVPSAARLRHSCPYVGTGTHPTAVRSELAVAHEGRLALYATIEAASAGAAGKAETAAKSVRFITEMSAGIDAIEDLVRAVRELAEADDTLARRSDAFPPVLQTSTRLRRRDGAGGADAAGIFAPLSQLCCTALATISRGTQGLARRQEGARGRDCQRALHRVGLRPRLRRGRGRPRALLTQREGRAARAPARRGARRLHPHAPRRA